MSDDQHPIPAPVASTESGMLFVVLRSPIPWIILWCATLLSPFPSNKEWDSLHGRELYPLLRAPSVLIWWGTTFIMLAVALAWILAFYRLSVFTAIQSRYARMIRWIASTIWIGTVIYLLYYLFADRCLGGVKRTFLLYDVLFIANALGLGLTISIGLNWLEKWGLSFEPEVAHARKFVVLTSAALSLFLCMGVLTYPWIRNLQVAVDIAGMPPLDQDVQHNLCCGSSEDQNALHRYNNRWKLLFEVKDENNCGSCSELVPNIAFGEGGSRKGSWYFLFLDCALCRSKSETHQKPITQLNLATVVWPYELSSARLSAIWTGPIQVATIAVFWLAFWLAAAEVIRQDLLVAWSKPPLLDSLAKTFHVESGRYVIRLNGARDADADELSAEMVQNVLEVQIAKCCNRFLIPLKCGRPDRSNANLPITAADVTFRVLNTWRSGGSLSDQRETLKFYQDEVQRLTEGALQIPRYLVWLMPSLGFIGTLVGIAGAFELLRGFKELPEAEKIERFNRLVSSLGVAFDTTFVAMLAAAAIAFAIHVIQSRDFELTRLISAYCTTNVIGKQFSSDYGGSPNDEVADL